MRYWFGDAPADFVVAPGQQEDLGGDQIGYTAILVPGAILWAWHYDTGNRITDLLDASGNPVEEITAREHGRIPRFRGPDGVRRLLIGQPPAETDPEEEDDDGGDSETPHRWVLTSIDWPGIVDGLDSRLAALEEGENGNGEPAATAHPIIWTMAGPVETRTSPHPYVNLEGKTQTITVVRAQATVTSGGVTARVLTMDTDTGVTTVVVAIGLDTTTESQTIRPEVAVSNGTGVTVQVELGEEADDVEDVTVQVMIR